MAAIFACVCAAVAWAYTCLMAALSLSAESAVRSAAMLRRSSLFECLRSPSSTSSSFSLKQGPGAAQNRALCNLSSQTARSGNICRSDWRRASSEEPLQLSRLALAGRDAILRYNGGLTNDGALALSFGTSDVFGDVTNSASGAIAVAGNSSATFYDDVTNSGTLNVAGGSTAVFFGALAGNGNVGSGDVQALGDLLPGASPGTMHFGGDLAMRPLTDLEIEIGGTNLDEYDRLEIEGTALLDGTLRVELIDLGGGTFVPQFGDQFAILAAGGGTGGTFDTLDLPPLGPGLAWQLNPGDGTLFLDVVSSLAGDYNGDGTVDAADYVVWRKNDGTPTRYELWRTNFGMTVGSGSVYHSPVPEPSSIILAAIALCCQVFVGTTRDSCNRRRLSSWVVIPASRRSQSQE